MRRLTTLRTESERGAVATILAILLGVGALIGMAAFTVDAGMAGAERRQLQNSADAGALSAAMDCAKGECPDATSSELRDLVNANAADGATSISKINGGEAVCGSASAGLPPCDDDSPGNALRECPSYSGAGQYVRVYTETENAAGNRLLPSAFAGAVGLEPEGEHQACAMVAWGPVGNMTATLPITFSVCEWTAATGGDPNDPTSGDYPEGPPYDPSFERVIYLQDHGPDTGCVTFNGHDAPGGFGWLEGDSGCGAVVTVGGWAHVDTGNNTPGDCKTLLSNLISSGNPMLYIPVYDCERPDNPGVPPDPAWDCAEGNGQQNWYHIAGFAQFYLTGWRLSGTSYNPPCSGGDRCLSGYFLKGLVPQGEISTDPTTPSFGLSAIQMVG